MLPITGGTKRFCVCNQDGLVTSQLGKSISLGFPPRLSFNHQILQDLYEVPSWAETKMIHHSLLLQELVKLAFRRASASDLSKARRNVFQAPGSSSKSEDMFPRPHNKRVLKRIKPAHRTRSAKLQRTYVCFCKAEQIPISFGNGFL